MFRIAFYKGTHKGFPGVYNRLVRWWTRSPYSHCELVFSDGTSASASYMDGGVRFKKIDYSTETNWDFIELPDDLEDGARRWFKSHEDDGYDLLGNLGFVLDFIGHSEDKWFCDEACLEALGILGSANYTPGTAYTLLAYLYGKK